VLQSLESCVKGEMEEAELRMIAQIPTSEKEGKRPFLRLVHSRQGH
jgi:hypothetical protein